MKYLPTFIKPVNTQYPFKHNLICSSQANAVPQCTESNTTVWAMWANHEKLCHGYVSIPPEQLNCFIHQMIPAGQSRIRPPNDSPGTSPH